MTDPLSEQVESLQAVASEAAEAARERDALASEIGDRLSARVEAAVEDAGTNVEAVDRSVGDGRFQFEARLDRAAMVATLTDTLPEGFTVESLNSDGTLTIEWTGEDRAPTERNRDAVLKAIVAEGTATDRDGLITSVPTRDRVIERAAELGIPAEAATERLERLRRLDMIDFEDGQVYPGSNFSRI